MTTTTPTKSQPVQRVRESTVQVSIWANQSKKGTFYKATVENSYLAGSGAEQEWKTTDSFSEDELTALATAALNARAHMRKLRLAQAKSQQADPGGDTESAA